MRTRFRQSIGLPAGASGARAQEAEQQGNRPGESGAESDAAGGAGESRTSAENAPEPIDATRDGEVADDGAGASTEHHDATASPRLTAAMDETVDVDATREDATAVREPREREARSPGGVEHPEWDWRANRYASHGSVVRERDAALGDHAWAEAMLATHAALVRRLRERFERLRSRRMRLPAQRDGDELDLAACVRALVDRRTGAAVDDRLYVAVRPARRGIAILLLVDISGSTDEWVSPAHRVIDVEKMTVLMASEALDALGDAYAVMTFSGRGRDDVRVRTVKSFADRNGEVVRRRIAALEPEGFTRLGAAVRHATARLAHEEAGHRLLLIVSDGKPNDEDEYEGRYGVEDSRQAIFEARASGVFPFCLTIDREGREYLTRIFGAAGHTILLDPEQLPIALLGVVRHLLAT